jgi:hypothetical protein
MCQVLSDSFGICFIEYISCAGAGDDGSVDGPDSPSSGRSVATASHRYILLSLTS